MKLACLMLAGALIAPAQVKLPNYTRRVLPSGAVVRLLSKSDVPMITLQAIFRGGSESDPAEMAGLASVTAGMLRRGTLNRTADEFSDQLDSIGASFATGVDEQATYVVTEFLSKDTGRALELFADVILHPTFPEKEAAKVLSQRIDAVKSAKDSPRRVLSRYFRSFFFPNGHPYARQIGGDELTLSRIRRADMLRYHKRIYTGKNLILVAAGDLDPAEFTARLSRAFGPLKAGSRYKWVQDVPELKRPRARLLLVDKPGATQTYFRIGQPGICRTDPDRVPVMLVNTLFGGRFTSMLNEELRVNAGLTYGAYSIVDRNRLPGALSISSFTATETTAQAIDLALKVLERFHEHGVTSEQLASVKTYVKGSYPTRHLETAGQLADLLGDLELYGLGRDEVDDLFPRIDAITPEQAAAAIQKHYGVDNLQFVLVGDATKIKKAVSKYASEVVVVPITKPGFGDAE